MWKINVKTLQEHLNYFCELIYLAKAMTNHRTWHSPRCLWEQDGHSSLCAKSTVISSVGRSMWTKHLHVWTNESTAHISITTSQPSVEQSLTGCNPSNSGRGRAGVKGRWGDGEEDTWPKLSCHCYCLSLMMISARRMDQRDKQMWTCKTDVCRPTCASFCFALLLNHLNPDCHRKEFVFSATFESSNTTGVS